MPNQDPRISQLQGRLDFLAKRQEEFSKEIISLKKELEQVRSGAPYFDPNSFIPAQPQEDSIKLKKVESPSTSSNEQEKKTTQAIFEPKPKGPFSLPTGNLAKGKSDLEKFIGENLINKIGIAITIIGVGIGAKYSIDNDLISPLTRIILGYLFGLGLLGFGIKLKSNYQNFSAVLVSGAMSILYFMTFFAYSLYGIIPQMLAFALMVIFTVFTVFASLQYQRQIIAHIGLVGAYAVPFLLSDGSGQAGILFSYMTIINIGILAIAIKVYWKNLYYTSFSLSWIIFLAWYFLEYQEEKHFSLAFSFATAFFLIFQSTFLIYKLLHKEQFKGGDIVLVLLNSFIYFGIGYSLLEFHPIGQDLLGVFTLGNALIHFTVSLLVYRLKLVDQNLQHLTSGLVLTFITLAVPVQLDGNWVTIIWAGQAVLLFWIGRKKGTAFYEKLSYILMVLAFLSILQDWSYQYSISSFSPEEFKIRPIINVYFLSSVLFIVAFSLINFVNRKFPSVLEDKKWYTKLFSVFIPSVLVFSLYYCFFLEIKNFWNQRYFDSLVTISGDSYGETYWNEDFLLFSTVSLINYSLLFFSILPWANILWLKNKNFALINLALNALTLTAFLGQGLYSLSELRESYLSEILSEYYNHSVINIWVRYISFPLVALLLYSSYRYIQVFFPNRLFKLGFYLALHVAILWIASSELIHWSDLMESTQSYKLGLSILWGVYSLLLIVLGIWKKNKPFRIGAIILFGLTLIKLFFYDISQLNTLAKTVVFVSLGILLLAISFLYNKYRTTISENEAQE